MSRIEKVMVCAFYVIAVAWVFALSGAGCSSPPDNEEKVEPLGLPNSNGGNYAIVEIDAGQGVKFLNTIEYYELHGWELVQFQILHSDYGSIVQYVALMRRR